MPDTREVIAAKLDRFFSDLSMRQQVADAALSALEAAGWVCVPVVPTTAMLNAGNDNIKYQIEEDPERSTQVGWPFASTVWTAMLTASNPKEKPNE